MKPSALLIPLVCIYMISNASARGIRPVDPVESYLKGHDKNKDGFVDRAESGLSETSFAKHDKNHDGKLSKDELKDLLHVHDRPEPKGKKK